MLERQRMRREEGKKSSREMEKEGGVWRGADLVCAHQRKERS